MRVGRCSAEFHTLGARGSTPGPATVGVRWHGTQIGKATRSRAWCLWVRLPPVLLPAIVPSSSGEDACLTNRIAQVRVLPGRLPASRSAGVPAAHLLGREGDRVRFSGGPSTGDFACGFPADSSLQTGCWSNGTTPASHAGRSGFDSPAVHSAESEIEGPMVQGDDVALAWRRSGFDSRWVHSNGR